MTPPDPQTPQDPERLLDALLGELPADEQAALEAALADSPALREAQERTEVLLAAEQSAFAPADDGGREARRVAAWIRDTVRTEEAQARRSETRAAPAKAGWARLLAWSVGVHVVLLGLLAWALHDDQPAEESAGTRIALSEDLGWLDEELDPVESEFARAYTSVEWRDVSRVSDELVLREQETYTEVLPEEFENLPPADPTLERRGLFDQPVGVVAAAVRRTDPDLKRRRLDLLGFNADGTLRAVEKGLDYLAPRQADDGSWSGAASERSDLEQTSIALLAFLGDGNGSRVPDTRKGRADVVGKGVRWLRDQLFNASSTDAERKSYLDAHSAKVLGPATVALCEDYMLSYGWLAPAAAEVRAREIAQLAARLETVARTGSETNRAAQAVEQPWAVWGLDAATRVGVVANTDSNLRTFRAWVESAASARPTLTAMSFLSVGTALLYEERGADKPRFLAWSKANAPELAARLGPGGYVRSEDPIGETALVLLGLQVAYRTY